jgi:hypothetical protein
VRAALRFVRAALGRVSLEEILAGAVLAAVAGATFWRLGVGVDLRDESFYAVVAQRFALGDRPYVDEHNLRQNASLLVTPFYWAYLKVAGSTDGIVYALRLAFFALQAVVGAAAYAFARTLVARPFALLAAAVPLAFIPFAIPAPSYNSLGSLFFALGTCLGLAAAARERPAGLLAGAGAAHGLAAVAYPPLALALIAAGVGFAALAVRAGGPRRWRPLLAYAAGVATVAAGFLAVAGPALADGLGATLAYERMLTKPRDFAKVGVALAALERMSPGAPSSLTALAAVGLLAAASARLRLGVLAFLPLLVVWWFREPRPEFAALVPPNDLMMPVVIFVGLLAPFFLLLAPDRPLGRRLLALGAAPSFAAGLVMATASDNQGANNAALGLLAAAIVAAVALPLAAAGEGPPRRAPSAVLLVALAAVPLGLSRIALKHTYWDGPVARQSARVKIGPFRGLRTLPVKASQIEELTREIRAHVRPGERLLVYYGTPAAYLAAPVRPALPTSWSDERARFDAMLDYYRRHRTGHGLAVVLGGRVSPALESLVERPDRLLKNAGWFRLYREPPP